jgi:murein L,D-transpeptidase YcbB/YkuD
MKRWTCTSLLVGALWLALGVGTLWPREDAAREILRGHVERLMATGTLWVGKTRLTSVVALPMLYKRHDFQRLWTKPDAVEQLLHAVQGIDQDGLEPRDYHWPELQRLRAELASGAASGPELAVAFDLLLTDSLIRLSYHLLLGKVAPEALDAGWNLAKDLDALNPIAMIEQAIEADAVARLLDDVRPKHVFYARLKAALAQYRAIQAAGGWKPVPAGPPLKLGVRDPRVIALRQRLMVTGDLRERSPDAALFDGPLREAVTRFQRRHGLEADGAVGPATLEALNVPVDARIDQIRANLERARWVLHEIQGNFVVVDIAGFRVLYLRDGEVVWTARAQVGQPYRKTPTFKAVLTYLVLNPTWTVPPSILEQDILPAVKRDPTYLQKRNLRVIDRQGQPVDARQLNWSRYRARNFPYLLRQEPGPRNALGRIKFMFPNRYAVYLHDTPNQALFDRPDRTFSSGCIRVERAFELAELLLNDPVRWSREALERAVASNVTRTVVLPRPVPVLLLYWTVDVSREGRIMFRKDVYERDRAVLAALTGEFEPRKRPAPPAPPAGAPAP